MQSKVEHALMTKILAEQISISYRNTERKTSEIARVLRNSRNKIDNVNGIICNDAKKWNT